VTYLPDPDPAAMLSPGSFWAVPAPESWNKDAIAHPESCADKPILTGIDPDCHLRNRESHSHSASVRNVDAIGCGVIDDGVMIRPHDTACRDPLRVLDPGNVGYGEKPPRGCLDPRRV
jgi:hypothetical protein